MEANGLTKSVEIKELYIFNSKFGNDSDNEMGKVLYCYPSTTSEDDQLKKIGLCEAIIKFAETFNTEIPCESLHTLKCRYVFHQPEPGYWLIVVLSIPSILKIGPEGQECIEYLNDEVQDHVFQAVLSRLYEKFTLLHDKFETAVENKGLPELKSVVKKYFDTHIQRIDANRCGLTDIFRGLQFLPLTRDGFLRIQCFINNLMVTWPQISYIVLTQRDKLIWSGVDQSHIQLLYDYLMNDLLAQHFLTGADKQTTYGVILKRESHILLAQPEGFGPYPDPSPGESENQGDSCAMGEDNRPCTSSSMNTSHSDDTDNISFMTASTHTINGHGESSSPRFHMLIYKAEQSYLTMLIPDRVSFDRQLITKLEAFLNLNFTPIARDLAKAQRSSSSPSGTCADSSNVKFIYFNNLNFAEKLCPGYQCDLEAYKLLGDLKLDLSKMNESGEITVKMVSENWLVAKVSNKREFYAIFNQKNHNILEIDEEMRKLTDAHLTSIFFQE